MGRGRAKAKQTKVARELKYHTGSLDPERLKAELASSDPLLGGGAIRPADDDDDEDEVADHAAR